MAYGTEPFTDGYGDFKQPTVVDYDKKVNNTYGASPYVSTPEEKEQVLKQFQIDQDNTLSEILNTNPFHAGTLYQYLVYAKDNKLTWDIAKINDLKSDVDWLYTFARYLGKSRDRLITT